MFEKDIKLVKKESRYAVKEAKRILKKYNGKLSADQLDPLRLAVIKFEAVVQTGEVETSRQALVLIEHLLENEYSFARKGVVREWAESLIFALLIAMFLRTFVVEAFKIPSGSMIPTLLVGDHIFVNKFTYGIRLPFVGKRIVDWGTPERGDVIVFAYPHDLDKDYIKRVIGIPGDIIGVRDQEVFVNGKKITQTKAKQYSYLEESSGFDKECVIHDVSIGDSRFNIIYDEFRSHPSMEYKVEKDHLFVMGDNRDNSADSRAWGQVPFDNIKGRAMIVWYSISSHEGVRFGRIGHLID